MDELIQELFLKGWEVSNVLALSHHEGVVAVGEDEGRKLLLIDEEMAAMDVGDGNLVLLPQGFAANERTIILTLNETNSQVHLLLCLLTMLLQFSMKLLCVSTRKSVRAVVHAPAPVVVGMRYSRGVSRAREERRCFSSTLRRAVLCACVSKGRLKYWGREEMKVRGWQGIYHGPSACLLQAPRLSADSPPSLGIHCECYLNAIK